MESILLVGRGKRSSVGPKDQFLWAVCTLKHGGTWHFNATVLKRKSAMFEKIMTRFIEIAAPIMFRTFVEKVEEVIKMKFLRENEQLFLFHTNALYAIDVMF